MALFGDFESREMKLPFRASAAVAASTSNISLVTVTIKDSNGMVVPYAVFDLYLSDSAAGDDLTGTTASGAVANGGAGQDFGTLTTKKALRVQAGSAGTYVLSITDTAKTAFKVVVVLFGLPQVVATLVTASYG